ncbi:Bax inhibitor-1/YccA family protein [Mycetocola lacteus]|uniref:Bax inhibitor-1/YccA family protein n=1 Tax=Mycetocola lacteus TaxID=76637 RepID=A0A3L7AX31_9MICO|nr:Bax inhibitor-1/YccA family protein [Mycetocola lacteus]RLP83802.1 Bax inhibitor-1/YccA family protein [Mycetocola lacteus]
MASNNPAFRNPAFNNGGAQAQAGTQAQMSAEQLQHLYNQPVGAVDASDRMTVEDTVVKTGISFAILVVGAVIGWAVPVLMIPAMIVGFVLAMVNIFKKAPSAPLVLAYAAAQGLFLGALSLTFERMFPGIVLQALIATLSVIGVTLALFASGKIRASKKATKIFMIAMVGYLVYSLVNMVLMMTGVLGSGAMFGLNSRVEIFGIPLGVLLGIVVVIMAAYSLVLDFDSIQRGVQNRAPKVYAWAGAFGIMVTVIWLYTEILRMIAIFRSN